MVKMTIDGKIVEVPEGMTILGAARKAGVSIPTLCYFKGLSDVGACRICLVEVEGSDRLVAACSTEVTSGMVVRTNGPKVRSARRTNVKLLLSKHDVQCTTCARSGSCQLQEVANDLGVLEAPFEKDVTDEFWPADFPLIRDASKCVGCLRCVKVCSEVQGVDVWDLIGRGSRASIGVAGGIDISASKCALCGQCITHCPTAALRERDDTDLVFEALADPERLCIVQVAPAIRAAWGESLGLSRSEATVERLASALRHMGFNYVFDTNFAADLTIMEEGSEFLARLKDADNHQWPMFTSCCPGWIRFIKAHYPHMIGQLSTAKSPQQMFGAIAKTYYAQLLGIDPKKVFCVSIMPCTAKKHECALPGMDAAGTGRDVDVVLTTREIERMIRTDCIDVGALEDAPLDAPLGVGTGAAVIFGATGGVMEAALRSAAFLVTGENPNPDAFREVRGAYGWREASFELAGKTLNVAVVSGLGNTRRLLDAIEAGEVSYDFVEVMACPGGCVGGGGQPISEGRELAAERGEVLYNLDAKAALRFSHENPAVIACYRGYLGEPLGSKSHHLLHSDHSAWSMPRK